ncbi:MAG: hypothetical protein GY909_11580 [Oligoflexia bacterium]|nr:hypothetical protein [Oligoflexia bacterium]
MILRNFTFLAIYSSLVCLTLFSASKGTELLSFEKYNLNSKVEKVELPKISISFELEENNLKLVNDMIETVRANTRVAVKRIMKKPIKNVETFKIESFEHEEALASEQPISKEGIVYDDDIVFENYKPEEIIEYEKIKIFEQKEIVLNDISNPSIKKLNTEINPIVINEIETSSMLAIYSESWVTLSDNVAVAQAAPVGPTPEEFKNDEDLEVLVAQAKANRKNAKPVNDELVFFEYSKDKKEVQESVEDKVKKEALANLDKTVLKEFEDLKNKNKVENNLTQLVNVQLSSNVQKVIAREMSSGNQAVNSNRRFFDSTTSNEEDGQSNPSSFLGNSTAITAKEVRFGLGAQGDIHNFQLIPNYNKNETFNSDTDGILNIQNGKIKTGSVLSGTIIKRDYVRTRVSIHMDTQNMTIPLFAHNELQAYLDDNNLEGYGGFLLINAMDNIDDLDIDNEYEHRVFLNRSFKVVSQDSEFSFIMFMGVKPGNTTISGMTLDGQVFNKISLITPDEVVYEEIKLVNKSIDKIKLWQFQTMASVLSELDIENDQAMYFNTKNYVEKLNINTYSTTVPVRDTGMRKYHELTHLGESIFIGYNENHDIETPSREFIADLLRTFEQDGLESNCLVQINFSDSIAKIEFEGDTEYGANSMDTLFLDADGRMGKDANPTSKKLFISGMDQGTISVKVDYLNGKEEIFNTFCSPGTYLVEQL